MKIIRLEILNLASLDRQGGETINFEEGALASSNIFSIVGPTGSGKSTLLDAICLALYNRAPRYPRKKGDRNQNIEIYGKMEAGEKNRLAPTDGRNILTRGKKAGYSKLTFLANDGTCYRAEWHVHLKTTKFDEVATALYRITMTNGRPAEEEARWDDLPQIIGLDYEQFLRTVLIAQGSFANFIAAREDERYELLEKLIGCKELYTTIATRIKQQKDEAVRSYDEIAAQAKAYEADIIADDELRALGAKIAQLEEADRKARAELDKVKEALKWYDDEAKIVQNITRYEKACFAARQDLEAISEQTGRLTLHDATIDGVRLYKEKSDTEKKLVDTDVRLKKLDVAIADKERDIDIEEKALKELELTAQRAAGELEHQQPHINRARQIMTRIEAAEKAIKEKRQAFELAKKTLAKAQADLSANEAAIAKAQQRLDTAQKEADALEGTISVEKKKRETAASEAAQRLEAERQKADGKDPERLAQEKTNAEREQTDLAECVRIRSELTEGRQSRQELLTHQTELTARNDNIRKELEGITIGALTDELDTLKRTFTLMTSENWTLHRHDLTEGMPCPLCGSKQHPYHEAETFAPIVSKMDRLIREKETLLQTQKATSDRLTAELSRNLGTLEASARQLADLSGKITGLEEAWRVMQERHADWPSDTDSLRAMKEAIDSRAAEAANSLKAYNDLMKRVDRLRKAKEEAASALSGYEAAATELRQKAAAKITDAQTALAAEQGKTQNLIAQRDEKAEALPTAEEALQAATADCETLTNALKGETGDHDPDTLEKSLHAATRKADDDVKRKREAVGNKREALKNLQGNKTATTEQRETELTHLQDTVTALDAWLAAYNEKHASPLTLGDIALLHAATDDWEDIRRRQKLLGDTRTSAETTLANEQKTLAEHQGRKPEQTREELETRKAELEATSTDELVAEKARMLRHEKAKQQMGALFEKKQEAESCKREWEQITEAIGSDGKTLRKIAQCYTLRFLVEHANAEIRKFNSRYELLQVKNSLGIRVIDHDRADDVRDTTSLSGGETFIVSLGLALGLSALSSRSIAFQNLFIDEGFGTLDPDTLSTVIDSLAMLQLSQGKKVGVISHTDTMSERITTQIRIIKNGNSGSSHIEIYPQ